LLGDEKSGGKMDAQTLIIWLIVGAVAGWLAGMVVKGIRPAKAPSPAS
jgi:hypothetical protein